MLEEPGQPVLVKKQISSRKSGFTPLPKKCGMKKRRCLCRPSSPQRNSRQRNRNQRKREETRSPVTSPVTSPIHASHTRLSHFHTSAITSPTLSHVCRHVSRYVSHMTCPHVSRDHVSHTFSFLSSPSSRIRCHKGCQIGQATSRKRFEKNWRRTVTRWCSRGFRHIKKMHCKNFGKRKA